MSSTPSNAGGLVGQRLGKYELLALLALGGTAEIYLARIGGVAGFEKYVVVKCLHDHLADDSEFVRMFLDEARLGAQLTHSNIVQTLELGEQQGRYYMVMEYLAGMSLAVIARKAAEHIPGGMLPVDLLLNLLAQACAGLYYAHNRTDASGAPLHVVHRDVSPQNLVVTFEGLLKVVDFGIAKAAVRETQTQSGTIKGKFAYMSPEQCHGTNVDHRTDVFALGIVLHEFLTGQRLFRRETAYETYHAILECKVPPPSRINPALDPALDAIVLKALTFDAKDRYQSAEELGDALTGFLHRRGKSVGAGEVAQFFDRHFGAEIAEHGQRMRALISGRQTSTMDEFWEEHDDPRGSSEASEQARRPSSSGIMTMDTSLEPSQVSAVDSELLQDDGDDSDNEDGATRIDYNPAERIQKRHDEVSGRATPPVTRRDPDGKQSASPPMRPSAPAASRESNPAASAKTMVPTDLAAVRQSSPLSAPRQSAMPLPAGHDDPLKTLEPESAPSPAELFGQAPPGPPPAAPAPWAQPNPGEAAPGWPQQPNPGEAAPGWPQPPNPGEAAPGWPQPLNPGEAAPGWPQQPYGISGMTPPMMADPAMATDTRLALLARWQNPDGSYPRWFLAVVFGVCMLLGMAVTLLIGAIV